MGIIKAVPALTLTMLAAAETHHVVAEQYFHTFSAAHPVLKRLPPGDSIVTRTVDSAGFDHQGVRRTKTHGNPLTGAFYIDGAEPGDTLVVTIDRLSLNRSSGYSGYQAAAKALPPRLLLDKPGKGMVYEAYDYLEPWDIDLERQTVSPRREPRLRFPAQPMLGCIGVAPQGDYSPRSGPSGYWGGNMDYNRLRAGTTVYLPVFHPGALLFFGDGHALQGDGELLGAGVETSLDVQVTVALRKGQTIPFPRAETAEFLSSIAARENSTMEERAQLASADMIDWLVTSYGLSARQAHLLVGMKARFDILSMAGAVALRLEKAAIPVLP